MKLEIRKYFSRFVSMRSKCVLTEKTDIVLLTPLTQLLSDTRPVPGLLEEIEAELDSVAAQESAAWKGESPKRSSVSAFVVTASIAAFITGSAITILQPQREIIVQQGGDAPWVSLGMVVLQGQTLQDFVHQKCLEQTHLEIVLRDHSPAQNSASEEGTDQPSRAPLMGPGEKILMECNF